MNLKYIRNVAFWTFLVIYLIITPLISFHALGFVIDPKTFHFVKTGIISIASEPKAANVSVNGKLYAHKTPVAVTGLLTGSYDVEIEAPHYQKMNVNLNVLAEEVTRIEHLLLIPEELSIRTPVSVPTELVFQAGDAKYLFLLSRNDNELVLNALDLRKRKLTPLFSYDENQIGRISAVQAMVSDDDKMALFRLRGNAREDYFVAGLANEKETLELSKKISESISNVRFNPKNSKEVFYLTGQDLNLFDIEMGIKKKAFMKDVRSFEVVDDTIYIFTTDFRLLSSNLQGRDIQNLLPDRGLYRLLFGEDERNSYRMFLTGKQKAFWLKQDGTLLTNRLPHFIDENVKGVQLVQDSEKLLFWKSNELWMIDMETVPNQEDRFFEQGPVKKLILATNRPVIMAQMIRGGHQVVLATDEELMLVQTEANLLGKQFSLVKHGMKKRISFVVDEMSGELYWADQTRRQPSTPNDFFI